MKGLFKFLAPFAPDYSGAVSVLFELGGLIVVYDAGGCTGNICGYDEPRWYGSKTALFSAGLRDMDAIFGRDDKLLDKIADATDNIRCSFIAIISTPAPSVIGTDFKALTRVLRGRTELPVFAVETNGMELYDKGQEKAYMELFKTFAKDKTGQGQMPDIGIIGATPLDMPGLHSAEYITGLLKDWGYKKPACYGMGAGLEEIKKAGEVLCNLVVSPSGLKPAKFLKEKFGTPYIAGFPFAGTEDALRIKIKEAAAGNDDGHNNIKAHGAVNMASSDDNDSLLVINQQVVANAVRESLRIKSGSQHVDVATWFMFDKTISESGDAVLKEEDDLRALITGRGYRGIVGDPLFKRAIPGEWHGVYFNMPHYAVSGSLYDSSCFEDLLQNIKL
ncbi:MAG: nitrogenase component 1 [Synergistaceae bacterium]|nr:nitrogenase component 1 [Synergistaceae bacterium]